MDTVVKREERSILLKATRRMHGFNEAMACLTLSQIARLLNRANGGGVDWRGSTKRDMRNDFVIGAYNLWGVSANRLMELRKEMFPDNHKDTHDA